MSHLSLSTLASASLLAAPPAPRHRTLLVGPLDSRQGQTVGARCFSSLIILTGNTHRHIINI